MNEDGAALVGQLPSQKDPGRPGVDLHARGVGDAKHGDGLKPAMPSQRTAGRCEDLLLLGVQFVGELTEARFLTQVVLGERDAIPSDAQRRVIQLHVPLRGLASRSTDDTS